MSYAAPYLSSAVTPLVSLHAGPFTITGWFEPTVSGGVYTPYAAVSFLTGPAWSITLNPDGTLSLLVKNSVSHVSTTVTTVASINLGWNFYAVVYDPNSMVISIWLNGVEASTPLLALADSTVSSVSPNGDFELGSPGLIQSPAPDGFSLDETGVWARALLSSDIVEVYNAGQGNAYPFLGGPFSLIFQANLVNDTPKPLVICSQSNVYAVSETTGESSVYGVYNPNSVLGSDSATYGAFMNLLYEGAPLTPGYDWTADNFSDKVILAQHDNPPLYWTPPSESASLLPGLPLGSMYDGVCVFQNHVLLWQGDNLIWSDVDDFADYIPIAETVVSAVLTLTAPFIQPQLPSGNVTVQVVNPTSAVASLSIAGGLSFPDTQVGTLSPSQLAIELENTGNVPITVTNIALPSPVFTAAPTSGTIPVGGSLPVIVSFVPTAAEFYGGSVIVSSNATTGTSVYPISGTGTGTTMVINLSGVLDFGHVATGKVISSTLVVTNSGNDPLNISPLVVTGITFPPAIPAGVFTTATTFPVSVAAGASKKIQIIFTPAATTPYVGNITLASNSTSGTDFIAVTGTGGNTSTSGSVFITDNGTCQFGNVPDGNTPTGTLTITNTSATHGIRVYTPVSVTSGFTAGPPGILAPAVLLPYHSTTLTVTFLPSAASGYVGFIEVPVTGAGSAPADGNTSILVTGTGTVTGAVIELSGSLSYGDVPFGSLLQEMLSISNAGKSNLTISSITYPANFSGPASGVVAAGQTWNFLVTFTPAASGSVQINYAGNLSIISNDTNLPTATWGVSGAGIPLPTPLQLVAGQTVTITDVQTAGVYGAATSGVYYNYYTVVSMSGNSLQLTLDPLTGATPAGDTIQADGKQFFTLDANEAGSIVVSGARMNGPIFEIIPQGDFAYIFKERSIQSIQYTGLGNGTFFIHNEISGEGLIGRNAVTDSGDGRMIFLGHKELYLYEGGPKPQPICQQYTRQLFAEVDRTKLYQILLFHNENRKEIWVVYPISGGTFKVLIWNYLEDSAALEIYSRPSLQMTAIGLVDWSADPTWAQFASNDLANEVTWVQLPTSTDWDTLVGASIDHVPVFGSADGGLRLQGTVYDREGEGYPAISETMDYDFGSPDVFKYCDVVVLALQIVGPVTPGSVVYIQTGTSQSLSGGKITWSDSFPVLVDGSAVLPVKVNPGGAGRYFRLRFTSGPNGAPGTPGTNWRIGAFEIHARAGSTY